MQNAELILNGFVKCFVVRERLDRFDSEEFLDFGEL